MATEGVEPQRECADTLDQRAQLWDRVARKVRDGFRRIEGKFSALAVVDHGTSVPCRQRDGRARQSLPSQAAPGASRLYHL